MPGLAPLCAKFAVIVFTSGSKYPSLASCSSLRVSWAARESERAASDLGMNKSLGWVGMLAIGGLREGQVDAWALRSDDREQDVTTDRAGGGGYQCRSRDVQRRTRRGLVYK